ncbi:hypothetical protein D479_10326 [Halobacillus sp. BAB-2008]|nr:hypothetical protein D479_10326 [Halobacillus sp. BAB-2008]
MWLIEDYFKPISKEGQQVLSKFSEQFHYSDYAKSAFIVAVTVHDRSNTGFLFFFFIFFSQGQPRLET